MYAPSLMDDTTAHGQVVPLVRQALQVRDVDTARAHFLQLPELEPRHAEWLGAAVRDDYVAGLVDINTIIRFLGTLPNPHWTLEGCLLLHSVAATGSVQLASFLHKLRGDLEGSAKQRAKAYWSEWVSKTLRAIVKGKPVRIESLAHREVLYAPADSLAFDGSRRNVFTWRTQWTPDESKDEWRFVPVGGAGDFFYLQSVEFDEFLYAADFAKFGRDDRGKERSRVFAWRDQSENVGPSGHWQLVPLDPQAPNVFAIYNPYQKEYLYSPRDVYDNERRHVLTSEPTPFDPTWEQERPWRITKVTGGY